MGGEDTTISNAEYYMLPQLGLQIAQQHLKENTSEKQNLLLVFDDVILHHFKERSIFDLANQPFAPVNIYNQIFENIGVF